MKQIGSDRLYHEVQLDPVRAPFYLELRLSTSLTDGDEETALLYLEQMNQFPKAVLAKNPLRSAKNSMICSCSYFARAAIQAGVLPPTAFDLSDDCIRHIEQMTTTESVLAYEKEMLIRYVRVVREFLERKYPLAIILALQYIDKRLNQNISLQTVADAVHMNANYLSNLFKQKTGESLTGYINRKRVEETAFFVAYTDHSFTEVAFAYQFCNQGYFNRVFKQYTGQTPGAYRKMAREQNLL